MSGRPARVRSSVVRAPAPMHGKMSSIAHNARGLFRGLNGPFQATRYHSLVVKKETLPACLKVTAEGRDPAHSRVHECMTPNPVSCLLKDSQRSVLALMARNQVRRIPVVDDQKRLVGIVGIADLIAHGEVNARDIYLVVRRLTSPRERDARRARAAA